MDHFTSLAFSLHSNKGAYALLLGSGISRASSIPTGWEITLDMIKKTAAILGEDPGESPYEWFEKKFNKEPSYSDLLDQLTKSPTERATYLKPYFEPNEQEREDGKKQPTAAHRAIARLVASGHIKVIVTTNFDRLLEKALEDEGVTPSVISSPDMCDGAVPLIHAKCTIIKVNGDYLDTRIKNTADELGDYDSRIAGLLDRVFDEFGLIICGWSGEWDIGLRNAIERVKGRRYSTYWTSKEKLSDSANALVQTRAASVVEIKDADSFFIQLEEKLSAIDEVSTHPLSPKLAVITLKKYIAEDKYKIRLHDLVFDELKKVGAQLDEKYFPMSGGYVTTELLNGRLAKYNKTLETLVPLVINGAYWSKAEQDHLWLKCIEAVASATPDGAGLVMLRKFRLYPALVLFYSVGVACVLRNNYGILHKLFFDIKIHDINDSRTAAEKLNTIYLFNSDSGVNITGKEGRRTPLNDFLYDYLREQFKDLVTDEATFDAAFDRFEYFLGLAHIDKTESHPAEDRKTSWAPAGRYSWKSRHGNSYVSNKIAEEMKEKNKFWAPIEAGFFGGSFERLESVKQSLDYFNTRLGWSWR